MGRRIYDNTGEFVWKYSFGSQPSEMNRITQEFHIGKYYTVEKEGWQEGKLKLNRSDVKKLRNLVTTHQSIVDTVNRTTEGVYNKDGLAEYEKIKEVEADLNKSLQIGSIYFFPMCKVIMDKAEDYFLMNVKRRIYTLNDEF